MEPEFKFALQGTLTCIVAIIILAWGVSDLVIAFNAPASLIFTIPTIVAVIIFIMFLILGLRIKKKNSHFNPNAIYNCTKCGSPIKLKEELCSSCGADNVKRMETLAELKEIEIFNENEKAKILEENQSKKWRSPYKRKLGEDFLELLKKRTNEVTSKRLEILVGGNTFADQVKWANTQYHDKNMSLQDIAEALGWDEYTARRNINIDSQNDKKENG
ncbi:MAG: hypothetical protein ACW986_10060 [Promethearchaeota archaeon]|jgi:hypothetical protein